jgi:hypothetical protein
LECYCPWIASAVAIIVPIITTIISNLHQSKLKHLEIFETRGLSVIEDYLAVISKQILINGVSESYQKCLTLIFVYAPESIHSNLEELNQLINNPVNGLFPDKEKCTNLLIKISRALKYDNI